jgi:hypothetical protein
MVLVQKTDRQKFIKKPLLYHGNGFSTLNNHSLYLRHGGFLASLLPIVNKGVEFVSNNKELISQAGSTVSSVADAVKAVSDTVKKSKEIEKEIIEEKKKKKKSKKATPELTPDQLAIFKRISEGDTVKQGSGFTKF